MIQLIMTIYTAILFLLAILYIYEKRIVLRQKVQLEQLLNKNEVLKQKVISEQAIWNRREHKRVSLSGMECEIEFLKFEDTRLNRLKNRQTVAKLENVSANGLKFSIPYNLPVLNNKTIVQISFTLQNQEFKLKGEVVRKEELIKQQQIGYGIKFIEMSPEQTRMLVGACHHPKFVGKS